MERLLRLTGLPLLVAFAAIAIYLSVRSNPSGPEAAPKAVLFRECANEVRITWEMRFLPNEQGETFKINLYDHGAGVAIGDFDGDGREDIYLVNQLGPNALYRNKGDGTFEDVAAQAGVALGDRVCVAATFVDYDNDGHQDLYVTSTRGGNVLFRNLGGGQFNEVTKEAGLSHVGHSQTALFFDYDNDGHLDLFLTNTAKWTADTYDKASRYWVGKGELAGVTDSAIEHNVMYRNAGNGTFLDVTDKLGLKGRGWAGDAVAFDYDEDGRMDLFVTSMFGRCQLHRNEGERFTDVTLAVLGPTPFGATGAKPFDLDNDGRLDLLVTDMHSDMWMGADFAHRSLPHARGSWAVKFPHLYGPRVVQQPGLLDAEEALISRLGSKYEELLFGNACYRNKGRGRFTEMSDKAGLETFWPWGAADGDFDNDGTIDVFIPAGMGYPFYYWPNSLMINRGDGTFEDRASRLGVEPPPRGQFLERRVAGKQAARSSRAAAVADFSGEGRLDLVVNNFNDQPYFFKNEGEPKDFVSLRLRGTRSNRDAIGAVVRLFRGDQVMTRLVQSSSGYLSQSSRVVHFGLGDQPKIDRVEITWPSGTIQRLEGVKVNAGLNIVEPR